MAEHIPEFLKKQALGKGDAVKEDAGPYFSAEQLPEYLGGTSKSKSEDVTGEIKSLLFKAGLSPGTEVDTSDIRTSFPRQKKALEKMQAEMDALARPAGPPDAELPAREAAKGAPAEQETDADRIREIRARLVTLEREAASPADYPHDHDELENEVLTLEKELRGLESALRPVSEKKPPAERPAAPTELPSQPAQETAEGSWTPAPLEEQESAILGELYGLYRKDANGPMEFDAIPEEVHQKFRDFFDTHAKNLSPADTIPETEVSAFLAEQRAASGAEEAETPFHEHAGEIPSAEDEVPIIPNPDDAIDPRHEWAMRRAGLEKNTEAEPENDSAGYAAAVSERTPAESRSLLRELIGRFTEQANKRIEALRAFFFERDDNLERSAKELGFAAPPWKQAVLLALMVGWAASETVALQSDMRATRDAWLARMLGHHGELVTATQKASQPAAAPAAGEVPVRAPGKMPIVEASPGRGYEYMLKQLWEQLRTKRIDPNAYAQDSDIRALLGADARSIDSVVHRIAADPRHGFFHTDGTSVLVDPTARMTIGAHGEVRLSGSGRDVLPARHLKPPSSRHPETSAVRPESPSSFVNKNNLLINPAHVHIFQDADGAFLAYGGTYDAQFNAAQEYVQAHHAATVWVQAARPISYKGERKSWVFPVRYSGGWRGVQALIPVGPPDPSQIGSIDPEAFTKQLE